MLFIIEVHSLKASRLAQTDRQALRQRLLVLITTYIEAGSQ
jgi:hypothetical protein